MISISDIISKQNTLAVCALFLNLGHSVRLLSTMILFHCTRDRVDDPTTISLLKTQLEQTKGVLLTVFHSSQKRIEMHPIHRTVEQSEADALRRPRWWSPRGWFFPSVWTHRLLATHCGFVLAWSGRILSTSGHLFQSTRMWCQRATSAAYARTFNKPSATGLSQKCYQQKVKSTV